ncbi:hypothetical protein A0J61_00469 [Choanephora cucurbitarum]|uniref:Uncharacterized protein n=1 Tax=Choanephora cucurbitarum TaxID=101091 RepID=A0A1C7NRE0_9FUNG|nr:hypothetical protein A0J61_00469 [Choanephora cucurbitarum]
MSESSQTETSEIPVATAFSIMFVTVGLCCFVWQTLTAGEMLYQNRKPIIGIVFFQALLGVITTLITLLTSINLISCEFRLYFSIVGVNVGDISLQFVLLWKAYLGNNRSKPILFVGMLPIIGIIVFILINLTIGRSRTDPLLGICSTSYAVYIVVVKAVIDCSSNAFLSACFILVIYKHYRVLGSSIQKTLLTEGLIYCFGVCFSNIVTGILLALAVLGGDSPILYTIDWYLASYLIIKQLRQRDHKPDSDEEEEEEEEEISVGNDRASDQTASITHLNHIEKTPHESPQSLIEMNKRVSYRLRSQESTCQCRQREVYYHHSLDNSTIAPSIATSPSYYPEKEEQTTVFYKPNMPVSLSPPPRDPSSFMLKEEEA